LRQSDCGAVQMRIIKNAAHHCQELRRRPRAGNAVTSYHVSIPRSSRRSIDARESN
jgi:hypothetical protein